MIETAQVVAPTVQGVVMEKQAGLLILALPSTDYRLHLAVAETDQARLPQVGQSVSGRILARIKLAETVAAGGRYIEPVFGRPRRAQGLVRAHGSAGNVLSVACAAGCTLICELVDGRLAGDYPLGSLVTFDIERGAGFELLPGGSRASAWLQTTDAIAGSQAMYKPDRTEHTYPAKTKDAGALSDRGDISGSEKPAGDMGIDE